MRGKLAALLALALGATGPAAAQGPELDAPAVRAGLDAIRPAALESHLRFLADDLLEGRGTGTRGYDLAARYVASRFEALGLDPGGERGSWFQPLPLRRAELLRARCGVTLLRRGAASELTLGRDFLMSADTYRTESDVTGDVVYVGFGITAREQGYDDFAGIDAKGKIVVTLAGAPPTFPSELRAHYSNGRVKDANLAAHGAIAVLQIRSPAEEKRAPWDRVERGTRLPGLRWLNEQGMPDGVEPALQCSATLGARAAEKLFADSKVPLARVFADADSGRARPFALPVRARLRRASRHTPASSANVAGLLRGSDPRLAHQIVIYSAHLDHLGIGQPVRGDSINNGAFDNATGVAALLEIAAAFAQAKERPRRSILFLAVTGEEKGLQGSSYFAGHSTLPGMDVVADLNMDMYVMIGPLRQIIAYGAEHSTLAEEARLAVTRMGLQLVPDPSPEENIFVRSDQYSFVRHGVPAVFLVGHSGGEADEKLKAWRREIYHSPQDDLSQPLDFESLAKFARVNFLVGYLVANRTRKPAWNPGDFFGAHFAAAARP
jgi:peptidase M28-like protein